MFSSLLEWVLWYLSSIHPLLLGTQFCRRSQQKRHVSARGVTNLTLAMIILWMLDMADSLLLSHLLSVRAPYVFVRIVLCLYLLHPKFRGAMRAYNILFFGLFERYAPFIDACITQNVRELNHSDIPRYMGVVGLKLVTFACDVMDIAWQLLSTPTETELPAANIERRMTPERHGTPPPLTPRSEAYSLSPPPSDAGDALDDLFRTCRSTDETREAVIRHMRRKVRS